MWRACWPVRNSDRRLGGGVPFGLVTKPHFVAPEHAHAQRMVIKPHTHFGHARATNIESVASRSTKICACACTDACWALRLHSLHLRSCIYPKTCRGLRKNRPGFTFPCSHVSPSSVVFVAVPISSCRFVLPIQVSIVPFTSPSFSRRQQLEDACTSLSWIQTVRSYTIITLDVSTNTAHATISHCLRGKHDKVKRAKTLENTDTHRHTSEFVSSSVMPFKTKTLTPKIRVWGEKLFLARRFCVLGIGCNQKLLDELYALHPDWFVLCDLQSFQISF